MFCFDTQGELRIAIARPGGLVEGRPRPNPVADQAREADRVPAIVERPGGRGPGRRARAGRGTCASRPRFSELARSDAQRMSQTTAASVSDRRVRRSPIQRTRRRSDHPCASSAFRGNEAVRRMFRAPLALAYPDLSLPAVNDCWLLDQPHGPGRPRDSGRGRLLRDRLGALSRSGVRLGCSSRTTLRGRARASRCCSTGPERIEGASAPRRASVQLADSGLAVLRAGAGADENCLILKAGPDGGGHGHPDQLAIQLFAAGSRLAPDLAPRDTGSISTTAWYRQSASHSSVLVGRAVSAAVRPGRLRPLHTGGDHSLACGSSEVAGRAVRRACGCAGQS